MALQGAVSVSAHAASAGAHDRLADVQRARIVRAMLDVACEKGASNAAVACVVERAGVSRRTFYELFQDREDCFHAAFEQALAYACERVLPAYRAHAGWPEKIRAALVALLSLFDEEPAIGRVLIDESLAGGSNTRERRSKVVRVLSDAVAAGVGEGKARAVTSSLTAEGVVGGALSVISTHLADEDASMVKLTGPLMSMIVLPYLGPARARTELRRRPPEPAGVEQPAQLLKDPFKDNGLRLTYRTVRVLVAIADRPGASNRLIADIAEIADQGQISKLLARLERAGMVANTMRAPGQGAPNSWALTPTGERVLSTIREPRGAA